MANKEKGFTLIELLVVIAIIVILAAILFPVFAKARAKALQTSCMSNLKQIGTACALYQEAYDEYMPPLGNPFAVGHFWYDLIQPYMGTGANPGGSSASEKSPVFRCPTAPEEEEASSWGWYRTYGMNYYCGYLPTFCRSVNKVKDTTRTFRVTESWFTAAGVWGGSVFAPMPSWPAVNYVYAPGWHNGFSNVLWIDGHATAMRGQPGLLFHTLEDPPGSGYIPGKDPGNIMYTDPYTDNDTAAQRTGNVWARFTGSKPNL